MKTYLHFRSYLAEFFLEREIFQTNVLDKIKTDIVGWITFSRKSCCLWDDVETYSSHTGHRWQYNMAHVLCMLDKYDYRHIFIIFYSYCFPTSTMVMRTRFNITLYVHCESCFMYSLPVIHTEANKLNLLKPYCQVTGNKFSEYRKPKRYLSCSKQRHIPLHYTS
jgi:hypothetical protein